MDDPTLYTRLLEHLRRYDRILVAFSGGVDSSLVLRASLDALGRDRVLAVTADSPSLARRELEDCFRLAALLDAPLKVIGTHELDIDGYRKNEGERCYFCKGELYAQIAKLPEFLPNSVIANGANADDVGDYRPGMKAAREAGVKSPLLECGIGKSDVRRLAKEMGIQAWDKPSSPCLASRVPYFSAVDAAKLRQIELAEDILHREGFAEVRVRHHGTIARIEVPPAKIDALRCSANYPDLTREICSLGFQEVEIDPEGLVSGKLNRALGSTFVKG